MRSWFRKARLQRSPLRGMSLFADLGARELAVIDALLHRRSYVADEVIFDEGEEGNALYIILDGEVAIVRRDWPGDGVVARLTRGAFFGDLALLDNLPRSAQARAATHCHLAAFFRDDFFGLLETHARIAAKILPPLVRHVGLRLREAAGDKAAQHL